MKTVFNNSDVLSNFSNPDKKQAYEYRNSSNNLSVKGNCLYSYHTVIATRHLVKINGEDTWIFFITSQNYSVTTSKIQSELRRHLSHQTYFIIPKIYERLLSNIVILINQYFHEHGFKIDAYHHAEYALPMFCPEILESPLESFKASKYMVDHARYKAEKQTTLEKCNYLYDQNVVKINEINTKYGIDKNSCYTTRNYGTNNKLDQLLKSLDKLEQDKSSLILLDENLSKISSKVFTELDISNNPDKLNIHNTFIQDCSNNNWLLKLAVNDIPNENSRFIKIYCNLLDTSKTDLVSMSWMHNYLLKIYLNSDSFEDLYKLEYANKTINTTGFDPNYYNGMSNFTALDLIKAYESNKVIFESHFQEFMAKYDILDLKDSYLEEFHDLNHNIDVYTLFVRACKNYTANNKQKALNQFRESLGENIHAYLLPDLLTVESIQAKRTQFDTDSNRLGFNNVRDYISALYKFNNVSFNMFNGLPSIENIDKDKFITNLNNTCHLTLEQMATMIKAYIAGQLPDNVEGYRLVSNGDTLHVGCHRFHKQYLEELLTRIENTLNLPSTTKEMEVTT